MIQIMVFDLYDDIKKIDQVILLLQKQMKDIKANKSTRDIDESLRNALSTHKRAILEVCYEEDEPIGFIFGNVCSGIESGKDYFWINEIHVKEGNRRKQIGSLLIKHMEDWLKDKDIEYVAAMTSRENESSKRFFEYRKFNESDVVWIDKHLK
jgi:GNAT superfamily N-acetyltransferase